MTKQSIILGIESSCDETACAIVTENGDVLANVISSQASIHALNGGVVPEIAAREHLSAIRPVIAEALSLSGLSFAAIDGVAATGGPGLIGGVLVGTVTAKAIACASGCPYYAVNHLEGHALTPRFTHKLEFPYLLLLVSGGHTQLLSINSLGNYERYGTTLDDAAGEAFDKGAKILGLGYPGGPAIENAAKAGNPSAIKLPIPRQRYRDCHFSFSGLKTALANAASAHSKPLPVNDFAASLQSSISASLTMRSAIAMHQFKSSQTSNKKPAFVVAGGVAANSLIRAELKYLANSNGFEMVLPPLEYCTDNAAMIAWVGMEYHQIGQNTALDFAPKPRWPLDKNAMPPPGRGVRQ
ncbi:tRNA (adenosine(37)-N6)-threonylcarbamoyltransferase complex transferase subunit TsaD [Alphaproteobacteria bacterium]|nr:tRNA (adenosine(37)-N6)-threonylcarbamoyltransferase complex transferase subunit TsaD [Alphaproteobacteria bacterium]